MVLPITDAAGVHLVINDHLDVARNSGAGWCHLGQEDFFDSTLPVAADVGRLTHPPRKDVDDVGLTHINQLDRKSPHRPDGQEISIGLSSHSPDQAHRAMRAGSHYVAVGPVFATGTKPTAKPVTSSYVEWAAKHLGLPWFAIGGIHLGNLDEVLNAGARRICVVSAILNAPDVPLACEEFRKRL